MKNSPFELEKYIRDLRYPASKDQLIIKAREVRAPAWVVETLKGITDRGYADVGAVIAELELGEKE